VIGDCRIGDCGLTLGIGVQSAIRNPQSTIGNQQSAIPSRQSQSAISNQQSTMKSAGNAESHDLPRFA
jgi:hypothetical protein